MTETDEPVLVKWEPRWTPPVVESTCPSCGARRERSATAWAGNVDGTLRARFACEPWPEWPAERSCYCVFDVEVAIEP